MSYYLRFLSDDDRPLAVDELMAGLADAGFRIDPDGILYLGDALLAHVELSQPGDGLFEAERDGLRGLAGRGGTAAAPVLTRLGSLTAILGVRVLLQGRTAEQTLTLLGPLWDWLLTNRRGLVHADGEGFFDGRVPILPAR